MLTAEQKLYELVYDQLSSVYNKLTEFVDLPDFEEIVGNAARDLINDRLNYSIINNNN